MDHPEEEEIALWLELYQSFAWVTEEEVNQEKYGSDSAALEFHAPALRWIIQNAFRALGEQQPEPEQQQSEVE